MKLRFLETAKPGLLWMKKYYRQQPQLDGDAATASFSRARERLKAHPEAGELFEDFATVREMHIIRTPFSILYTIEGNTVFVIDIRDARGLRSASVVRSVLSGLRVSRAG